MSRPTKGEIRAWLKRLRTDLVGLNKALSADNPTQVKLFTSDALGCLEEIAGAAEERYEIEIRCAEVGPCSTPSEDVYDDPDDDWGDLDDEGEEDGGYDEDEEEECDP